jgi:hypothetical protein
MSNINKGAKKAAKKATAKKKTAKKMAAPAKAPRREDIPGIARDLPDISDWRQAARALKIRHSMPAPNLSRSVVWKRHKCAWIKKSVQ